MTGRTKKVLEDHFDRSPELEASLEKAGKTEELSMVRAIAEMANIHYVRQGEPKGLGHAVAMARHHVGDEPFAVLLGDDLMAEGSPLLRQMIAAVERHGLLGGGPEGVRPGGDLGLRCRGPVAATLRPRGWWASAAWSRSPARRRPVRTWPSWAATCSPRRIFDALDRIEPGEGRRAPAHRRHRAAAHRRRSIYGLPFIDGRYDTGNKLTGCGPPWSWPAAPEDLGPAFRAWLSDFVKAEGLVDGRCRSGGRIRGVRRQGGGSCRRR